MHMKFEQPRVVTKVTRTHCKRLTESQAGDLVAHLRDYIHLMETMWPNKPDAVKSRARALFRDIEGREYK